MTRPPSDILLEKEEITVNILVLIGWRAYELGLDEGYREYQKGLL